MNQTFATILDIIKTLIIALLWTVIVFNAGKRAAVKEARENSKNNLKDFTSFITELSKKNTDKKDDEQ